MSSQAPAPSIAEITPAATPSPAATTTPPSSTPSTSPSTAPPSTSSAMAPKPAVADDKKLSTKELKEQKKAEKAARRQQNKAAGSSGGAPPATPSKSPKQQQQQKSSKKATQDGPVVTIRLGTGAPSKAAAAAAPAKEEPAEPKYHGLVGLLKELENEQNEKKKKPRQFGIDVAHPEVHPAILTLGMLINKREIVGSTARCLGFLLAIKRVIEDYETPEDSTLNRHLPAAYLSHQINYLTSARPMATAMGNTIRWLKAEISNISPDITDEVAKRHLVNAIENFIHERITAAGDVIVNTACERYIEDHDVILVFAKSQLVENTLLEAKRRGKQFRVVVVDSRPLEEGRNLLGCLCENDIEAEFVHLYALDYAMQEATKVFLGANAVMADGSLYSRSGTAVVALAAQAKAVPVLVLCETVKFSDKINIDGIVTNELAPPDLLVNVSRRKQFPQAGYLDGWKDVANTTVVNFMYDVTPAEYLTLVICEHGCVTPEGVSAVMRMSGLDR